MPIKLNGATSGSVELDVPATVSGGDVNLTVPGAGTLDRLERAGNILQVVQTVKTDTASHVSSNTNSFADITGMSVSITPSSASSKILVQFTCTAAIASGTLHLRLLRGSTSIFQGDADSNQFGSTVINRTTISPYGYEIATLNSNFLDSPNSTSALTYKLQWTAGASYNTTLYLNRSATDDDADYAGRTASSITVMEVAV